jgi:hypothetical protein
MGLDLARQGGINFAQTTNYTRRTEQILLQVLWNAGEIGRGDPIRHQQCDVPLVAKTIVSLCQILFQELEHFLCRAP